MESIDCRNFLDYVTSEITSSANQNLRFFCFLCPRDPLKNSLIQTRCEGFCVAQRDPAKLTSEARTGAESLTSEVQFKFTLAVISR